MEQLVVKIPKPETPIDTISKVTNRENNILQRSENYLYKCKYGGNDSTMKYFNELNNLRGP